MDLFADEEWGKTQRRRRRVPTEVEYEAIERVSEALPGTTEDAILVALSREV